MIGQARRPRHRLQVSQSAPARKVQLVDDIHEGGDQALPHRRRSRRQPPALERSEEGCSKHGWSSIFKWLDDHRSEDASGVEISARPRSWTLMLVQQQHFDYDTS